MNYRRGRTTNAPWRLLFGIGVSLLACAPLCATETVDTWAGFDEYATAALADLKTPGMAIAVVKEGKVVFSRGYGVRRAGSPEPVDDKTIFPIASVTKVFTATCLAQLVEERRLKWSDPVIDH